jgi:hypothetical protein
MANSVYIETSFISYLCSQTSRDLVLAGRQQQTNDWWNTRSKKFEIFISELVIREASEGDKNAAAERMKLLHKLGLLDLNEESYKLAEYLIAEDAIPKQYPEDALHVSVSAVHGIDYLLTWNFKHINNAFRRTQIERCIRKYGYECPIICTPEELMEDGI